MFITYELPNGQTAAIYVDALINESPNTSAQVTRDPVEGGVSISDHVILDPEDLTIEGLITNTPIDDPGTQMAGVTGAPASVELPQATVRHSALFGLFSMPAEVVAATVLQWSGSFDRVGAVEQEIRRLVRTGTLVSILTGLRSYEPLVITSFRPRRDGTTGDSLPFTLTASEVRFAETETVEIPTAERRGQRGRSRGVQPTTPEPRQSMLTKIGKKVGKKVGF